MKKFTIIAGLLGCILITWKFGIILGGGIILLCVWFAKVFAEKYAYSKEIDRYKVMIDDVIVISRHPKTGEELDLPEDLKSVVVWADYECVIEEVADQKEWLREAGNRFFVDPSLLEHQKIHVHSLIYQDGEFINEDWNEEFFERAVEFIKNKRAIRHGLLKSVDPVYYNKIGNRQRGVVWSK